ncbi:MAG: 50S ribosomal protein L34e [Candidatus Helarchaeota archaeon]
MPEPRYRSRSKRRKRVSTPSGKNKIHYSERKTNLRHCALCHRQLHGVPRAIKSGISKINKARKRPERIYGGYLCYQCLKAELKKAIRIGQKF